MSRGGKYAESPSGAMRASAVVKSRSYDQELSSLCHWQIMPAFDAHPGLASDFPYSVALIDQVTLYSNNDHFFNPFVTLNKMLGRGTRET